MINNYKNYYFITEGVSNYGGAQLLVLRKAKYLKELGFNVKIIIHRHRGDFILEREFENFPILYLPDIELPFSIVSTQKKRNLIETVRLFFQNTNSSIIESHSLQTAIWGEYFASHLGFKHIIYLLNEAKISKYRYYPGEKFFYFKYNRRELFGNSDQSLKIIFNDEMPGFNESYINVSFDPEEIVEKTSPPLPKLLLENNSIVITTISRLEKKYVHHLIEACINYVNKHPGQMINLIIGGGTIYKQVEENLKKKILHPKTIYSNLNIFFTGYLTELGKDLFLGTDIFVGMGTASINAISQGCATLNIDPETNLCSGIFGIDTDNFAYAHNNRLFTIEEKLSALLNNPEMLNNAKQKGKDLFDHEYTNAATFTKLKYLLEKSEKKKEYFDFKINFRRKIFDFFLMKIRNLIIKIKSMK